MPKIQITERLVSAVNAYLGKEFIPSLEAEVRKHVGPDEDVSKYTRPGTINSGPTEDGEINLTLYSTPFVSDGEGTFSVSGNYAWRFLDAVSNMFSLYVQERRSLYSLERSQMLTERKQQKEYANIDDRAKTKLAIAALFDTWEVEPEFLDAHAQEIDALRGQFFENWQSGVSSIDEYFVKE